MKKSKFKDSQVTGFFKRAEVQPDGAIRMAVADAVHRNSGAGMSIPEALRRHGTLKQKNMDTYAAVQHLPALADVCYREMTYLRSCRIQTFRGAVRQVPMKGIHMTTNIRKRTLLALTLAGTLVAQSALACKAPAAPRTLPDGRIADAQAMQDAKRQVEQYVDLVSTYFTCESDALKLQEVSEEQKAVVKNFNAEVRAFRLMRMVAAARPAG